MSDEARAVVARLAHRHPVAIISGRDLDDVRRRVAIPDAIYAGSHGFDIAGPDGLAFQHPGAIAAIESLATAEGIVREAVRGISGAFIERKRFTLAVHYRNVAPDGAPTIARAVECAVRDTPALRRREGKMVHEIQPAVDWHKGRAVQWILDAIRPRKVTPVYLGDDLTDEDAFAVVEPSGLGIVVGEGDRQTHASLRLRDPAAALRWLARAAKAW